ncbi:MAG: sugar kinase [Pseudomonadota bacterium]
MTRVAMIGEAMIELSMRDGLANIGVAGDTLNTAIYLKRCAPDVSVDYISCIGDDPFSDQIESFISAQDIGTSKLDRIAGKSPGLYAITTTDDGERSFTYWRSASAARDMFQSAQGTNFISLLDYDLIYISGISVAILPNSVRHDLLEFLAKNPVKLAYDSNYRPRLWEDIATARQVTSAFWARADICLPSIDDEMALFDETAKEVEQRFLGMSCSGALKRGAEGPLSLGDDIQQKYLPASKVVDTTAAGDSFNGGYLAAYLSGQSQADALLAGHNCAARVVQHRGAIIPLDAA